MGLSVQAAQVLQEQRLRGGSWVTRYLNSFMYFYLYLHSYLYLYLYANMSGAHTTANGGAAASGGRGVKIAAGEEQQVA